MFFYFFFENLLLKIELSEITPFFYNNFFGFGGGVEISPLSPPGYTLAPPHQPDNQQALNTSLQPQAQGNFQSNIGATNDKFDNNVKLLNKPKIAEEYRNTKRKAVKEDNTGNSVSTAKLEVKTNTQDSDSNSPIASKEKTVTKSVLTGDMFANLKFR